MSPASHKEVKGESLYKLDVSYNNTTTNSHKYCPHDVTEHKEEHGHCQREVVEVARKDDCDQYAFCNCRHEPKEEVLHQTITCSDATVHHSNNLREERTKRVAIDVSRWKCTLDFTKMTHHATILTSPNFLRRCQSKLRLCKWLNANSLSCTNAAWPTRRYTNDCASLNDDAAS